MTSDDMGLTETDRNALQGLERGQVPAVVVGILADHYDRWEWNYGERVRRLTSELEEARASLAAARNALAAVREVRAERIEREGR